jgi:MFS family permease
MAGILAVSFFYSMSLHMLQTITPLYIHDAGLSPAVLGALIAFPSLFQIFLRVPGGIAADRWGERTVLGVSALCMGLAAPIYLAGKMGWLVAAQALTGLSRAVFWPSSQAYVTKMQGSRVGRRLGVYNMFLGVGNIIGPVVAGLSIAAMGYGGAFALLGVVAAACLGSVLLTPPPAATQTATTAAMAETKTMAATTTASAGPGAGAKTRANSKGGRTIPELLRLRPLLLAGLCQWAAAVPMAVIGSFLPVYLREIGMDPGRIGMLSGMRGVCIVVASVVFAWGFDKIRRPVIWVVGMGAAGVGLVGVPWLVSFAPLAVCVALMGLASSALQMLPLAIVTEYTLPEERGLVMAITGTLWGASLFVHPLAFGFIAQRAATGLAFYFAGVPLLALAAATGLVFRWGYGGAAVPVQRPAAVS